MWDGYTKRVSSNNELWLQLAKTMHPGERAYILLRILVNATDGNEKWKVYNNAADERTREEALLSMLPSAETMPALQDIASRSTDTMEFLRAELVARGMTIYREGLRRAKTNHKRWRLFRLTSNVTLRNEALSDILEYSTSDTERWKVFFHAYGQKLREQALAVILKHSTSLGVHWEIFCYSRSPELKKQALRGIVAMKTFK